MKAVIGTLAAVGLGWLAAPAASAQAIPPPVDLGPSTTVAAVPSQRTGGFVQRELGRDEDGNPILGTVYQAGSRQRTEWRRSTRGRWVGGRYRSSGHGIYAPGSLGGSIGQPVWQFGAGGWCYPVPWQRAGIGAWPVVIGGGPAGGFSVIVTF